MAVFGHVTLKDIALAVRQIVNLLQRPIWMNASTGAVRSVDTVATVTTIASVTNIVTIGGVVQTIPLLDLPMRDMYYRLSRPQIS